MCDFNGGFKLCTCDLPELSVREKTQAPLQLLAQFMQSETDANPDAPPRYYWLLQHVHGKDDNWYVGRAIYPDNDIGHGLDNDWVAFLLNAENCFDFDYAPQEQDTLTIISASNPLDYLSFVYRDGQWQPDAFLFEKVQFVAVAHGQVKPSSTQKN